MFSNCLLNKLMETAHHHILLGKGPTSRSSPPEGHKIKSCNMPAFDPKASLPGVPHSQVLAPSGMDRLTANQDYSDH